MRRRDVGLLIVGWLLGLLTAFVLPAVSTERQTIVGGPTGRLASLADAGWIVVRTDTVSGVPVVQLERPRYLGVAETLRFIPPVPPTPPPRPTDSPKPTTAPGSASPGGR
jgi:hypothetical protein